MNKPRLSNHDLIAAANRVARFYEDARELASRARLDEVAREMELRREGAEETVCLLMGMVRVAEGRA